MKGGLGAQPQPLHCRANLRRDVPRGQGDPTKQRYLVRLNEYIAQISRVGNNYNQVVKAINTYLSRNMLPRQIDTLVACTREFEISFGAGVGADQTIAGGVADNSN